MKKTALQSLLIFLFIINFTHSHSQNLKKAFKLFDDRNYDEAYTIFTSGENMNSCIGTFGEALILHNKPLKFMVSESEESKKRKLIDKKLSAYFKVNLSESKLNELSEKDLKSLKDHFSEEKLTELKKEIESFFLELDNDEVYLNLIIKIGEINKESEFYTFMETKYIDKEFNKIKSKNYISDAEKLIKKFPDNNRTFKIQRYVDSMRVVKATGIYSLSDIYEKYPDNHFKDEITEKIKKYNIEEVKKIKNKGADYQKIKVWKEYDSEKDAIGKLIEWYNYYRKNHNKSPKYYYLELTDNELKMFGLSKKFLLFEHSNSTSYDKAVNHIVKNKSSYPDSYVLDLGNGLQIFSKEKVYLKGNLLDTYNAIIVILSGKYRASNTDKYRELQDFIKLIEEKTKLQVFNSHSNAKLNIYPEGNPFYFHYYTKELPECDMNKDACYFYFISSYKNTYLFEIDPENPENELERIMHKVGFYFR